MSDTSSSEAEDICLRKYAAATAERKAAAKEAQENAIKIYHDAERTYHEAERTCRDAKKALDRANMELEASIKENEIAKFFVKKKTNNPRVSNTKKHQGPRKHVRSKLSCHERRKRKRTTAKGGTYGATSRNNEDIESLDEDDSQSDDMHRFHVEKQRRTERSTSIEKSVNKFAFGNPNKRRGGRTKEAARKEAIRARLEAQSEEDQDSENSAHSAAREPSKAEDEPREKNTRKIGDPPASARVGKDGGKFRLTIKIPWKKNHRVKCKGAKDQFYIKTFQSMRDAKLAQQEVLQRLNMCGSTFEDAKKAGIEIASDCAKKLRNSDTEDERSFSIDKESDGIQGSETSESSSESESESEGENSLYGKRTRTRSVPNGGGRTGPNQGETIVQRDRRIYYAKSNETPLMISRKFPGVPLGRIIYDNIALYPEIKQSSKLKPCTAIVLPKATRDGFAYEDGTDIESDGIKGDETSESDSESESEGENSLYGKQTRTSSISNGGGRTGPNQGETIVQRDRRIYYAKNNETPLMISRKFPGVPLGRIIYDNIALYPEIKQSSKLKPYTAIVLPKATQDGFGYEDSMDKQSDGIKGDEPSESDSKIEIEGVHSLYGKRTRTSSIRSGGGRRGPKQGETIVQHDRRIYYAKSDETPLMISRKFPDVQIGKLLYDNITLYPEIKESFKFHPYSAIVLPLSKHCAESEDENESKHAGSSLNLTKTDNIPKRIVCGLSIQKDDRGTDDSFAASAKLSKDKGRFRLNIKIPWEKNNRTGNHLFYVGTFKSTKRAELAKKKVLEELNIKGSTFRRAKESGILAASSVEFDTGRKLGNGGRNHDVLANKYDPANKESIEMLQEDGDLVNNKDLCSANCNLATNTVQFLDCDCKVRNHNLPRFSVGTKVRKKYGSDYFLGTIVDYDVDNECYLIQYENGDKEEFGDEEQLEKLITSAPSYAAMPKLNDLIPHDDPHSSTEIVRPKGPLKKEKIEIESTGRSDACKTDEFTTSTCAVNHTYYSPTAQKSNHRETTTRQMSEDRYSCTAVDASKELFLVAKRECHKEGTNITPITKSEPKEARSDSSLEPKKESAADTTKKGILDENEIDPEEPYSIVEKGGLCETIEHLSYEHLSYSTAESASKGGLASTTPMIDDFEVATSSTMEEEEQRRTNAKAPVDGEGDSDHNEKDLRNNKEVPLPLSSLQPAIMKRFSLKCPSIKIRHSCGRPRVALNHLISTGKINKDKHDIYAKFSQSTFCTKNNRISQLVLTNKWNVFVDSTTKLQEFYIGVGKNRSKLGREILAKKTRTPIPLFFDPHESNTCIYYVGHWMPLADTVIDYGDDFPICVYGHDRCMKISFKFDHYNEELANVIEKGESLLSKTTSTALTTASNSSSITSTAELSSTAADDDYKRIAVSSSSLANAINHGDDDTSTTADNGVDRSSKSHISGQSDLQLPTIMDVQQQQQEQQQKQQLHKKMLVSAKKRIEATQQ